MSGTFISYRGDDAKPWALLLRDELVDAFGERNVFLDKDALRAGSWREQLEQALDQCGVVLVVIGRLWLDVRDSKGARRLDDVNDVHRREIATALARQGVTVIPVLVDGASVPRREDLPDDIRALADQQARSLADRASHRKLDLDELVRDIERATGAVAASPTSRGKKRASPLLWTLGLALILFSVYLGVEIDYRHWTGAFFLFFVPVSVVAFLVLRMRA